MQYVLADGAVHTQQILAVGGVQVVKALGVRAVFGQGGRKGVEVLYTVFFGGKALHQAENVPLRICSRLCGYTCGKEGIAHNTYLALPSECVRMLF